MVIASWSQEGQEAAVGALRGAGRGPNGWKEDPDLHQPAAHLQNGAPGCSCPKFFRHFFESNSWKQINDIFMCLPAK